MVGPLPKRCFADLPVGSPVVDKATEVTTRKGRAGCRWREVLLISPNVYAYSLPFNNKVDLDVEKQHPACSNIYPHRGINTQQQQQPSDGDAISIPSNTSKQTPHDT